MSVLINQLSGLCKKYLLDEKWLIALNYRIGFQLIDRMVMKGMNRDMVEIIETNIINIRGLVSI